MQLSCRDVFRTGGLQAHPFNEKDEIYIDLDVAHHRRHYLVSFSIFSAVLPERQTALHVSLQNVTQSLYISLIAVLHGSVIIDAVHGIIASKLWLVSYI